jgi:hypothetical protein
MFAMTTAATAGCLASSDAAEPDPREAAQEVDAGSATLLLDTGGTKHEIVVRASTGQTQSCRGICVFGFPPGTLLGLSVVAPTDRCELFRGWLGACAGQGTSCRLTLSGDAATHAVWEGDPSCPAR